MNYYKLPGCVALLLFVLIFPVSASMVSILLVETGLNEEAPLTQHSSLWEGALMSSFFDAGHIVTNSPILRLEEKPQQALNIALKSDFEDAASGGADFIVLCLLEFQSQARGAAPADVSIRTYRADTQELIFEQNFPTGRGRNQNEEYQFAQNAGNVIVSRIMGR